MHQNGEQKLLTALEVSQRLRLPRSTVYYLTQKGQIPAVRFGKHYRYQRDAIDQFLAKRGDSVFLENGDHHQSKEVDNRREAYRINTHLNCRWKIQIADYKSIQGDAVIVNLSEGGLGLKCDRQSMSHNMAIDDPIQVEFKEIGQIEGRIVYLNPNGAIRIGIQFRHLNDELKNKIKELVG